MITELIMGALNWVVGLLPAWNPIGWASEYVVDLLDVPIIGDALGFMMYLDHWLPVRDGLTLLGLSLGAVAIGYAYSGIMWVWRNLPGKAT